MHNKLDMCKNCFSKAQEFFKSYNLDYLLKKELKELKIKNNVNEDQEKIEIGLLVSFNEDLKLKNQKSYTLNEEFLLNIFNISKIIKTNIKSKYISSDYTFFISGGKKRSNWN